MHDHKSLIQHNIILDYPYQLLNFQGNYIFFIHLLRSHVEFFSFVFSSLNSFVYLRNLMMFKKTQLISNLKIIQVHQIIMSLLNIDHFNNKFTDLNHHRKYYFKIFI
jgi:hypothetical protein